MCTDSPEHSLLLYTKYGRRYILRSKLRQKTPQDRPWRVLKTFCEYAISTSTKVSSAGWPINVSMAKFRFNPSLTIITRREAMLTMSTLLEHYNSFYDH